jgi:hypothetical protein
MEPLYGAYGPKDTDSASVVLWEIIDSDDDEEGSVVLQEISQSFVDGPSRMAPDDEPHYSYSTWTPALIQTHGSLDFEDVDAYLENDH